MNYLKKLTLSVGLILFAGTTLFAHSGPPIPASGKKTIKSTVLADMKFKNVQFGFNKTVIPEVAYTELNRVAKLMKENNAALELGGYADNKGGYVYNWKLSKSRADAVKAYLVTQGADESRIAATEYGYTKPIAPNQTKSGRQKNRRVEVHFAE